MNDLAIAKIKVIELEEDIEHLEMLHSKLMEAVEMSRLRISCKKSELNASIKDLTRIVTEITSEITIDVGSMFSKALLCSWNYRY